MPIDDFEIGKILGKGAYSSVVLVKRHKDSKTYAMKRVKISQLSPKDKQNALNEIRILASLSHINIIGYKEAFFDDITQTLNIVMEYAEDGDLQSKIKSNKKKKLFFSEETIWNILIQILEGINYLHENKIMHRDLKSANIFINKNGIVKIGDLNVSKVTQFGFASTHTGTPYYASPEVWKDNPYDYKCDIWSIGVILYELCTLNVPFRGTNLKTLVKNINSGVYDNISSNYSKDLNLILSLMLVVNPNKRKSAKELLLLDFVKEKNKRVLNNKDMGHAMLMKTIKMPCNLCDINRALPKKRYNDNEKMLENDEYEIMKESIKEGGFGINFKELVCETDESNNNNNNNNINNNNNNVKGGNDKNFGNVNNNNNNIVQNNNKVKKPIIIKKKSAIDDLYDKIFNRKNNNNNNNNNYNNNQNNQNYNKGYNNYNYNYRNQDNNKNNNNYLNNNDNKNLNFDYNNNKNIENVVNNIKMEDIVNENYQNKEINNGKNDNQNIKNNVIKDENKKEYNYEYGKNDMKKENDRNNIDTMGKLENKINNYKNELENLRNKFNNRKNENYNFVNKINFNNNNNYNNFRNDNENERKKQLMNKINKIKLNYNKNHNNPSKFAQIIERNPKENNNKYTPHYYYKNDNSINNNNNKKNELFENEFKNLENKYKYNKQIQLKKDVNNNIGKYQKMNNYNYYNYNNIYSNQERVNQRPISANINNNNFNKGDDFFNQFKEKYNINIKNNNNNNRDKSPLIGRRNYLNNERKNDFEKYNLNEYMRNNNKVNLNNYLHNNQNYDKNQFKYQNHILKKPYDFNNNYFNNNKY